jgi:3-hydroxyacyl-CoA dehydrogenase
LKCERTVGNKVNNMLEIKKVAVLGANGTMGSSSGGIFAQAGITCLFFSRSLEKSGMGIENAVKQARSDVLREYIEPKTYEELEKELPHCDWVLEAVAEDLSLKREYFRQVDRYRKKGSVVSTISSSLSVTEMAVECSEDFKAHFMGVHFFNPPAKLLANELIFHPCNSNELKSSAERFCAKVLRRENVLANDTPGFAGNRIGFQFLNEAAIRAETHGVGKIDYLLGPHTGRALPPLATVDLVGLDVHREIVNNIFEHVKDERHDSFILPGYMRKMIDKGMLGAKSRASGGFYRFTEKKEKLTLVPSKQGHEKASPLKDKLVERVKLDIHDGNYGKAVDAIKKENSDEMSIIRHFILGYISYSFSRIGEVTPREEGIHGIDKVMAYGFSWFPPSAWVDFFGGPRETAQLLDKNRLPVPEYLKSMPEGTHCRVPEVTKYLIAQE